MDVSAPYVDFKYGLIRNQIIAVAIVSPLRYVLKYQAVEANSANSVLLFVLSLPWLAHIFLPIDFLF